MSYCMQDREWFVNKIVSFYNEKYGKNAQREMRRCEFTSIDYLGANSFVIKLRRPGMLFGVKGKNLEELSQYIVGNKIYIVEDTSRWIYDELDQYLSNLQCQDCL